LVAFVPPEAIAAEVKEKLDRLAELFPTQVNTEGLDEGKG